MASNFKYNCLFKNYLGEFLTISIDRNDTIEDLIHSYFKRNKKENLFINNIENTYFICDGKPIDYKNKQKISSIFNINFNPTINVFHLDYKDNYDDIEIVEKIKEKIYTCVYKAKYKENIVAVKTIKKKQLKDDIKDSKCVIEITEEDFKNEIIKFNKELSNMKICYCENSVEIYDYFDMENEFVIIMELCDSNLFKELTKTKNGFNEQQIKEILLQLNNVFRIMNENNIVHRDIKLHNILVKYLNEEKTKFKVLLSDYGVSNQLNSMTQRYKTHAGTQIIMAPEILSGKKYNNKCDLWSLGINIYFLYTKKTPYNGTSENMILNQIKKLGQSILKNIKDEKLKDLLSKLLVIDPEKRISWEDYFNHSFFKEKIKIDIEKYEDIELLEPIKTNVHSSVYKGKYKDQFIAVKKINKESLKEEIMESKLIDEITEEDFKEEIIKFDRELSLMKKCYCENSVEIYASFDTKEEFIIVMELCDNTLFYELAKTENGFNEKEIRDILLQLNNAFRKLNENNIAHRDIKLHNILVKYLNKEKTKFKVLLSDYGVSNQLNNITQKYQTFAGTKIIMAPEILKGEEYNNKCDLWSLGIIIYQLYTKKIPYNGEVDNEILEQIKNIGQSILDKIKDEKLKDLLSKLLIEDPDKRISWEEYFKHDFFK